MTPINVSRQQQPVTGTQVDPVVGSIERIVEEDGPFASALQGREKRESLDDEAGANGARFEAEEDLRVLLRLGGNGY